MKRQNYEKLKFVLDVLRVPPRTVFYYETENGANGFASKWRMLSIGLAYWNIGFILEVMP